MLTSISLTDLQPPASFVTAMEEYVKEAPLAPSVQRNLVCIVASLISRVFRELNLVALMVTCLGKLRKFNTPLIGYMPPGFAPM